MSTDRQHPDEQRITTAVGLLATLAGDSEDALIATDVRGVIVSWNGAAERLFGYAEAEAIGAHVSALVPEEHDLEQREILGEVLAGSRVERYEGWRVTKDQRILDVSLTTAPLVDDDGAVIGVSKRVREITDVHEARRLQAQVVAIVENADDAIMATDLSGTILSWNPAAERLFGYSSDQAIGRPAAMLVPVELREFERGIASDVEAGHKVEHFETKRVAECGRTLDVSLTESPLRDASGEIIGISMIIRDVTHQKQVADRARLAEDLAGENARLAAADLLKNQFLAMASHEMRTPLTAISGFTRTMREMWPELADERKQEFVSIIDTQARRLQRLVDDLLTMGRIESGAIRSRRERLSVRAAVEQVVRELGADQVTVDCPDALDACADGDQVQQILTNLVGNAIKYGAAPITVSARSKDGGVEIRVSDQGPGVPGDFVPHLFERFSRAVELDADVKGTGLGLSITRGLAHAQGGRISYEPNQPRGACFVVLLPAPDGSSITHERRFAPERSQPDGRRVGDQQR